MCVLHNNFVYEISIAGVYSKHAVALAVSSVASQSNQNIVDFVVVVRGGSGGVYCLQQKHIINGKCES